MRQVTHVEFYIFIKNYPSKLDRDVVGFCEPPALTFNDFSSGKIWPESVVAKASLYEIFSNDKANYPYIWKPNKYYLFNSEVAQ